MYRVCLDKNGKLIEMQGGGSTQEHLETLIKNAINMGYEEKDIEVKFVNEAEWQDILTQNKSLKTYAQLREEEYPPIKNLVVTLWERVVEGRSEESEKIQKQRLKIKTKYPK